MNLFPELMAKFKRSTPTPPPDLRCIETIAPKGPNWVVNIETMEYNMDYLHKHPNWNEKKKFQVTDGTFKFEKPRILNGIEFLIFYQLVSEKPLDYLELLQQQSLKNSQILYGLTLHIKGRSADKICTHVFKKKGVEKEFVKIFYSEFLRTYFRRKYNWFCLNLLIRARVAFPEYFDKLVEDLIRDVETPSSLMLDYAATLNEDDQAELFKVITNSNLNNVEFCHTLKLIHFLFVNCEKTVRIYEYVLLHLEIHAVFCSFNIDYGRLLHAFMLNMADFQALRIGRFPAHTLLDTHGTVFKAACSKVLDDMIAAMLDAYPNRGALISRRRFCIPREPTPSFL